MTTEEKTKDYFPGVFVAIVLIVPTMLILAIVAWECIRLFLMKLNMIG